VKNFIQILPPSPTLLLFNIFICYINILSFSPQAQEHHVSITLMLTLTDIFTALSPKSKTREQPPPSAAAVTAANTVATALLSRRLRSFYSHLASSQRTRATAALLLLAAIASFSPSTARELVRVFDFGLSALPQLARSIRPRKGETSEQAGIRQRQEWANSDPVKRPTRAAFTSLFQALLLSADAQLLPEVLRLRPLLGGTLHHLSNDPPVVQLEILKIVQKKVLASKTPLGPATKAELFSDATLGQLAAICAAGEDDIDNSVENEEENENKKLSEEESLAKIRRQASDLSFSILHSVCIDANNGLCSSLETCLEFRTLQSSSVSTLNPGQRRLLRWLQRLKPAESSRQGELLRATVAHDPALAAAMLLSLPYSMEPTATGKWLVHASIVGSLMQSVASAQVGLVELAERGLPPPALSAQSMQAMLRCALPLTLPRSALSRGVQHSNALVRHTVLCLIANMLSVLQSLLKEVHQAVAAISSMSSSSSSKSNSSITLVLQEWRNLETAIQQTARACLPDLQPILAQLSAALNPSSFSSLSQKNNGSRGGGSKKNGKASVLATEMETDTINIVMPESEDEEVLVDKQLTEEEDGEHIDLDNNSKNAAAEEKSALNTALFSATMHVLQRWRRCLPISFAESNVDAEKLVPEQLATLPPLHQLQMLSLLQIDSSRNSGEEEVLGGGEGIYLGTNSIGPALLPVLKLLASCDENKQPEVKNAASSWAVERLTFTGLFEVNPAEAFLWIDLIPVGPGIETGFLYDAISLVLRKPAEFYSFFEAGSQGATVEMSLLVLCVLRQALRVISSEKKSLEEKETIGMYTARVAALAVMQQKEAKSTAAASSALLNVLVSEASRQRGTANGGVADGDAANIIGHKRKALDDSNSAAVHAVLERLGPAAQPLAALATWLEAGALSSSSSLFDSTESNETAAKKKSKKANKESAENGSEAMKYPSSGAFEGMLLILFSDLQTITDSANNIKEMLEPVPLSQLSLAVFHLGQTEISSTTWSNDKMFDYISTLLENDSQSQRAAVVIRQALHFICTNSFSKWKSQQPHAASMLCAVVRGAIAATLKKHPSSFNLATSCIFLVCSSESLLKAIEDSEAVAIELWEWLFVEVTATATGRTSPSFSLIDSLRPLVATAINNASKLISKKGSLQQSPDAGVFKLLPLAVAAAAASGSAGIDAAKNVLCSILNPKHIKKIDAQWIDIAGRVITSLLSASKSGDVQLVLKAGCRAVADLLAVQRLR
jgi:Ribosome 60S biogenesis N-terminal